MKNQKKLIVAIILVMVLLAPKAWAETGQDETTGVLPTSKLYFLKTWGEWAKVNILTFNKEKKAELYLSFADRRLSEMNELQEQGKLINKKSDKLARKYQFWIEKAKNLSTETSSVQLSEKMAESTLKHEMVLKELLEKVPDPAKEALSRAHEVSTKENENTLRIILKTKNNNITESDAREAINGIKNEVKANYKFGKGQGATGAGSVNLKDLPQIIKRYDGINSRSVPNPSQYDEEIMKKLKEQIK